MTGWRDTPDQRGDDVNQHGNEVAEAAAQYEEMPHCVVEGKAVPEIENDATGVGEAAGEKPRECATREALEDRPGGDDADPPHRDIEQGRNHVIAAGEVELEDRAGQGHRPEDGEQAPPPGAADQDEEERGVSAGDQKVDRDVVEDVQA